MRRFPKTYRTSQMVTTVEHTTVYPPDAELSVMLQHAALPSSQLFRKGFERIFQTTNMKSVSDWAVLVVTMLLLVAG